MDEAIARPGPVFQIFSICHCGSMLLHQILNMSGKAWFLSEPVMALRLAMGRRDLDDAEITGQLRAGYGFLRRFAGVSGCR
jgi:hypothetical protein